MGFWPSPIESFHNDSYAAIDPSNPKLSAKGKTVFVTGGGGGIGAAIAKSFAQAGSTSIAIIGRRKELLQSTKTSLESAFSGLTVWTYSVDITDRKGLDAAFADFATAAGKVKVLVCSAGYMPNNGTLIDSDNDDFWKGFEINVQGNVNVVRAFAPHAAPNPTVISVATAASIMAPQNIPVFTSYATSKLAAARLFEFLQVQQPEWNVYNVHPGVIETEMGSKAEDMFPKDAIELPSHFAVWLASDEAIFLKGKFVWASWDVEEMKAKEKLISQGGAWTFGMNGWPKLEEA